MSGVLQLRFAEPPAAADVDAVRQRWWAAHRLLDPAAAGRPFIVITPLGLTVRDALTASFAAHDITVVDRRPVADWAALSTLLYARRDDDERLTVAIAFEQAWRAIGVQIRAECWVLEAMADLERATSIKAQLHASVGLVRLEVHLPGVTLYSPGHDMRLRAFHVPDLDRVGIEWQLLEIAGRTPDA